MFAAGFGWHDMIRTLDRGARAGAGCIRIGVAAGRLDWIGCYRFKSAKWPLSECYMQEIGSSRPLRTGYFFNKYRIEVCCSDG